MADQNAAGALIEEVILDPSTMEAPEEIAIEITDAPEELTEMASTEESAIEPVKPFDENLADALTEAQLDIIANELLQDYEQDLQSRADWDNRFKRGLYLLGIVDDAARNKPFPGASEATHPVLAEAMVQFNARAITELFPPGGPVKGKPVGRITEAVEEQRGRIEAHMNYQYVEEMPEAFNEMDKLTLRMAYEGTSFKKVLYDRLLGRMRTIYVSGRDVVVPYEAQGLDQAPRVSHRYTCTHNTLLKRMQSGEWRKVEIAEPEPTTGEEGADKVIADSEGRAPTGMSTGEHDIVEMQVYYNLPGYEDIDPETGEKTGIGLPYIITMEANEQVVLAIRRDWEEGDVLRKRLQHFATYGFIPGFGFYYLGLIHWIGGLAEATIGTVRALLDSAQFAAAQGGFKSKEARAAKGEVTLEPGKYKDIDLTSDELQKAFYTPPYKEPPVVLFQLLGALTDYARRFASTTEAMVGEANNNGPVGTTLALIEQGMKVFSAIHKRMHQAQMQEFRILARLNAKHLPDTPRPISWNGGNIEISRKDYDGRVDVIPVSDPNLFSQTQRIALAQGIYQLAKDAPQLYDMREVNKVMLDAMGVDRDQQARVMPDPERNVVPLDPVTENQLMLLGKPVRAFPHQSHAAHNIVHDGFFALLPPEMQQRVMPVYLAHKAEHLAHEFRVQIESQLDRMNLPLPPLQRPNLAATGNEPAAQIVMPDVDDMVAQAVAAMMQQSGIGQGSGEQEDPETLKAKAEIARKDKMAEADEARKDRAAARQIARDDEKFKQELELRDARTAHEILSAADKPKPNPSKGD